MTWEALRTVTTLIASAFLLTFSRQRGLEKRRYDFSFLLGLALLAWGISHLLKMQADPSLQLLAKILQFFFYLFLLLAFHAFLLAPHLYYERWKSVLDVLLIGATFSTCMFVGFDHPSLSGVFTRLPDLQCSMVLLGTACTVLLVKNNQNNKDTFNSNLLLLSGSILFLLLDTSQRWVSELPLFAATALILLLIIVAEFMKGHKDKLCEQKETHYLYEKLQLTFYHENLLKLLFVLFTLPLIVMRQPSLLYIGGTCAILLILAVRYYKTRANNLVFMRELFFTSRQLEMHVAEKMNQIQRKNEQLSRYVTQQQSYEKLLMISNELNLRKINYETLQEIIEELVEKWFRGINGLANLRLSLQSESGIDYFVVERGRVDDDRELHTIHERLTVKEEMDSPLAPRYVSVMAAITTLNEMDSEEMEAEQSFVKLLAINVRGFVMRCLYDQESLERRLMEQEMELASRIQFSLIPKDRLVLPELQAKAVYIPYTYVGGDYVDYLIIDHRYSCFLIADVAGHGMPSSLLTTVIRSCFRAVIETCRSPEEILERINRLMFDDLCRTRSYVTMFVAVYDSVRGVLRTSRAGHPHPLYLSASKQVVLSCSGGVGLGLSKEAKYKVDEWEIEEDFVLLIYTDGLTELGRKAGALEVCQWITHFGQVIRPDGIEVPDRINTIEQDIWKTIRQKQQEDDISVLIIDVFAGK